MAKKIQLRLIIVLLAALALRLVLTAREVQVAPGFTLDHVPAQLGAQPAVELPLSPFEMELLAPEGGQILQRRYGEGSNVVWLAAVQSKHDWRVQHPPQICYTAKGWRIVENGPHMLPSGDRVQRMVVQRGDVRRVVYYLYTDGHHWTTSYFWRIYHSLVDRAVRAQVSTWALIQFSTPLNSTGAEARLAAMCAELKRRP